MSHAWKNIAKKGREFITDKIGKKDFTMLWDEIQDFQDSIVDE